MVVAYIRQRYKGSTIKEAAELTTPGRSVNFEAEEKGMDVIFDANGNFIKTVKD